MSEQKDHFCTWPLCKSCKQLQSLLRSRHFEQIDKKYFYDAYSVRITYSVQEDVHNGQSCRKFGEKEKHYTNILVYPLLRCFKQSDIDPDNDNEINCSNDKLNYYNPDSGLQCSSHGCSSETWSSVSHAQVILNPPKIILDE